jgi:hypothetical protein
METKDPQELGNAIDSVHKEPHPYVTPDIFNMYQMRTVSFVGKIKEIQNKNTG